MPSRLISHKGLIARKRFFGTVQLKESVALVGPALNQAWIQKERPLIARECVGGTLEQKQRPAAIAMRGSVVRFGQVNRSPRSVLQ